MRLHPNMLRTAAWHLCSAPKPFARIRRVILVFSVAFFALVAGGCLRISLSPREAFFRAHPEQRAQYSVFYEVSPEALVETFRNDYNRQQIFIRSLQKEFARYSDLSNHLETVHTRELQNLKTKLEFFEQVRADFDSTADTLFHYRTDQEYGWLVVRGTDVRRRHAAITAR